MHGMGKLLSQARNLGSTNAAVQAAADHAEAMRDLGVLLQRCQAAELRVTRVQQVIDAFTGQLQQLPEEHPVRTSAEQMLATFRSAIK
jgi:hypothetical protein